jgi:hypothetical protein
VDVAVAIAGPEKHGMHATMGPGGIAEDTDDRSKSKGATEIIDCCFPGAATPPPPPMAFPDCEDDCIQGDEEMLLKDWLPMPDDIMVDIEWDGERGGRANVRECNQPRSVPYTTATALTGDNEGGVKKDVDDPKGLLLLLVLLSPMRYG